MLIPRYWMTGCMALVLLAAQQVPARQQRQDPDSRRGPIKILSRYNFDETIRKLGLAAQQRGLPILAMVGPQAIHMQGGRSGHLSHVLVFGNEGRTTPVFQGATDHTIDLPLKVVVAEQPDGSTQVTINDLAGLASTDGLPTEMLDNLAALPALVDAALS